MGTELGFHSASDASAVIESHSSGLFMAQVQKKLEIGCGRLTRSKELSKRAPSIQNRSGYTPPTGVGALAVRASQLL